MAVIRYNELKEYLTASATEYFPSACLLYGEEFLYQTGLEDILLSILPASKRHTNVELIEGTADTIFEAIEKLNTFSLIPGEKVIVIPDAKLFYSTFDTDDILEKAKRAYEKDDVKTASKELLTILGLLKLSFDDVTSGERKNKLNIDQHNGWIQSVVHYCEENGLTIPAGDDMTTSLAKAVESGFPKGNHLMITTDIVDKKNDLFNVIAEAGLVVDCSVPKSDRAADKKVQESVTYEKARAILKQSNKVMGKEAYNALYDMTGFDLRTFANNLEKLISFVGEREDITETDVNEALDRTKTDPIYEFTNAITERNAEKALFYLGSLLSGSGVVHPLQILSSMVNQVRKLLIVKDFTQSTYGKSWYPECSYDEFRSNVLQTIATYDSLLVEQIHQVRSMAAKASSADNETPSPGKKKTKTSKKDQQLQELMVAKNPNNPYPVYKMLKHSDHFSKQELLISLERLSETDMQLKSSPPSSHKLILEETILHICRKKV